MSDSQSSSTDNASKTQQKSDDAAAGCRKPGCPDIELDFSTFVVSLGTSALVGLGVAPDPETGRQAVDLDLARQNIDILALLCQKTKGNLDAAEEKLLHNMLYDLRLAFVKARR